MDVPAHLRHVLIKLVFPAPWSPVLSEAKEGLFAGEENGIIKEIKELPISVHTFEYDSLFLF